MAGSKMMKKRESMRERDRETKCDREGKIKRRVYRKRGREYHKENDRE